MMHAQSYEKEQVDFNLGAGIGNTFLMSGNYFGPGYSHRSLPLINLSGEYAVTDAVGIGAFLGYASATSTYSGNYNNGNGWYGYTDTYKWSFTIVGARVAYHFAELIDIDKLDVYVGLMGGINFAKAKYSSTGYHPYVGYYVNSSVGAAYSLYGGCRYRFNEMFGVFGEVGYGLSILNIGITYKRD